MVIALLDNTVLGASIFACKTSKTTSESNGLFKYIFVYFKLKFLFYLST